MADGNDHADAATLEAVPDQKSANIAVYAKTYAQCLREAKVIAKEAGTGDPVEIATAIFRQFNHDQIELVKQNQLIGYIGEMMRKKGL